MYISVYIIHMCVSSGGKGMLDLFVPCGNESHTNLFHIVISIKQLTVHLGNNNRTGAPPKITKRPKGHLRITQPPL